MISIPDNTEFLTERYPMMAITVAHFVNQRSLDHLPRTLERETIVGLHGSPSLMPMSALLTNGDFSPSASAGTSSDVSHFPRRKGSLQQGNPSVTILFETRRIISSILTFVAFLWS